MPKGKPNSYAGGGFIKSMREKHEPHMKLAGRVEGLEKEIPIAIAQLHKTLSKSFGMQRKTLLRVAALEKQFSGITIIIEKIEEGLEDAAADAVKKPPRKKRPRKKPPKKSAKKPTPKDGDKTTGGTPEDEMGGSPDQAIIGEPELGIDPDTVLRPVDDLSEDHDDTTTTGDDIPKDDVDDTTTTGDDIPKDDVDDTTTTGDDIPKDDVDGSTTNISEDQQVINKFIFEDLKSIHFLGIDKRVSTNEKKITLLKNILKSQKSDIGDKLSSLDPDKSIKSPLNKSIQSIADSVTSIHQTLLDQQDLDKENAADTEQDDEQDSRDAKEMGREKGDGEGGTLQKTGEKMLKPVKGAFDRIKEWLIKLFAAKAIMMFMDWFSDPANAKKVSSIFRFIKDWWPAIVTGLLLFAGSMLGPTGIFIGIAALVVGFIPKIVNAIKSIFGFGKDVNKEAAKGEKEASKAEKLADKQDKGTAGDDLKPEDDPKDAPEPGTQQTPGEKAPLKMNTGGEVPGKGDKDTVPAMLTPGEFVMSKGAVEEYGVNTLEGMNAAAGGTNIPTLQRGESKGGGASGTGLLPRYAGGGSASGPDKSHLGQEGYRMGQVRPEMMVYSNEKYESTYKTKGGEVIEDKEDYKEISGSIAVEDLMANQKQLMGQINKVEGFENTNIIDVMERVNGRGRLVGMPDDQLYPILNASDAWKETDRKRDEGIAADQEAGTQFLNPIETAKAVGLNGGGLVPGYAGGGLINKLPQVRAAKFLGGKAKGVFNAIKNKISLASNQRGTSTPGAPVKPSTMISYAKKAMASGGSPLGSAGAGGEVPDFDAGAKVSPHKVKVLGISR